MTNTRVNIYYNDFVNAILPNKNKPTFIPCQLRKNQTFIVPCIRYLFLLRVSLKLKGYDNQ